jgi:6-phosphofructokinase 1
MVILLSEKDKIGEIFCEQCPLTVFGLLSPFKKSSFPFTENLQKEKCMETMASGNLLVIQSGTTSCASNASLSGIIAEALDHECIGEIYGGLRGFSGILGEHFIDLAAESQQNIRALKTRAGAALGLGPRAAPKAEDWPRILEVLKNHQIRYFFIIGDRSAQEELFQLHSYAQEQAWPLQTMGLPQSIDNDLAVTDHCPGYGSALKYIATTVREVAMDGLSSGLPHLVSVVEVAGRHTGDRKSVV